MIILGAGVGALLLASRLSAFLRVVVLEKANHSRVRSHYVTKNIAAVDTGLAEAIEISYKSIEIGSDPDGVRRYDGDYRLWNLNKMAAILSRRITENGSRVFADDNDYSGKLGTDFVEIGSRSRAWQAKIAIDFMGVRSPLSATMPRSNVNGLAVVLAGSIPFHTDRHPAVLANVRLSAHSGFIEHFPMPNGDAQLSVIAPANHLKRASNSEQDLQMAVKRVSGDSGSTGLLQDFRSSIFASLKRRRYTSDRIMAIEEPEDCAIGSGAALAHALQSSADMAIWLRDCVKSRRTRARDLASGPIARFKGGAQLLTAEKHLDDRIFFSD